MLHRLRLPVVLIAGLALLPRAASAQEPANGLKITLQNTMPARKLIAEILDRAGAAYVIGPAVQGDLTVNLNEVPFEQALKLTLGSCEPKLTYRITDGVYVIEKAPTGPAPDTAPKVTVHLPKQPDEPPRLFTTMTPVLNLPASDAAIASALELEILALRAKRDEMLRFDYTADQGEVKRVINRITALQAILDQCRARAAMRKARPAVAQKPAAKKR